MKLKNSKVFVTGAGGFIGSHLCSELVKQGATVTAMLHYNSRSDWSNLEFLPKEVKNNLRVVKGNVEDSSFMDSATRGLTRNRSPIEQDILLSAPNKYASCIKPMTQKKCKRMLNSLYPRTSYP